jgi:uncharacterized protein (DUF58 family)
VSGNLIAFIFILLLIAGALGEDYVLTLIYLLGGVFIVGRLWSKNALEAVSIRRTFTPKAFLGERVIVKLKVENAGWLPVVWLQLHESFSLELGVPGFFKRVISLGPKGRFETQYQLMGRKRGYYQVGPTVLHSGDILGLFQSEVRRTKESDHLVVYPKIIPLTNIKVPSHSPLGTLKHPQPIFEDPSRVFGKRDYVTGDSMRRVDWKSSAAVGSLQVKLYEPSMALETAIFLDLEQIAYNRRTRIDDSELSIVVAASMANWITGVQQSLGLYTNGRDAFNQGRAVQPIPPRRGREHLMKVLEALARVETSEEYPMTRMMRDALPTLPWGATIILITGSLEDDMFDTLFQARRSGIEALLILVGRGVYRQKIRQKAYHFGFPIHLITLERDLDIWRI